MLLWGWAHKAGCLCRRKARLTAATTQEPREAAGTGGGFGWAGRTVDRLVFVLGGIFSPRRFCSCHIAGFLPRLEGKDQSSDQVQPGKGTSDLLLVPYAALKLPGPALLTLSREGERLLPPRLHFCTAAP